MVKVYLELGGMTKNVYHGIFLNYTGFTVYDGIFFPCMTGCEPHFLLTEEKLQKIDLQCHILVS